MVTTTRFGDPVENIEGSKETPIINNRKLDRFGNPIEIIKQTEGNFKFNSTSSAPKKDNDEGFIEKYIVDPVTAGVAGVGEGAFKLAEGTLTLGTILLELGIGSDVTRKVEKYFDENKILQAL